MLTYSLDYVLLVKLYIFGRTLPDFFHCFGCFRWICLFQVLSWKWAT